MSEILKRRTVTVSRRLDGIGGSTRWVNAEEGNDRVTVDTPNDGDHCRLTAAELRQWAAYYLAAAEAIDEAAALQGLAATLVPRTATAVEAARIERACETIAAILGEPTV